MATKENKKRLPLIRGLIENNSNPSVIYKEVLLLIASHTNADIISINSKTGEEFRINNDTKQLKYYNLFNRLAIKDYSLKFESYALSWPTVSRDLEAQHDYQFLAALYYAGLKSYYLFPFFDESGIAGVIQLGYRKKNDREIVVFLNYVSRLLSSNAKNEIDNKISSININNLDLNKFGNLIVIRTDIKLRIVDIYGDSKTILGLNERDLYLDSNIWKNIFIKKEFRKLKKLIIQNSRILKRFSTEVEIINSKTNQKKYLQIHAIPLFDKMNNFQGWQGVGVDITDRVLTSLKLKKQSKRLDALLNLSNSLSFIREPSKASLASISYLSKATNSCCGLFIHYPNNINNPEILSSFGIGLDDLSSLRQLIVGQDLFKSYFKSHSSKVFSDISKAEGPVRELSKAKFFKSLLLNPVISESKSGTDEYLGLIVLFSRTINNYNSDDIQTVQAASNQISLYLKQSRLWQKEKDKKHEKEVLYQLNSKIFRFASMEEIAESSFTILTKHLSLKRFWMGTLNEQGTHIKGIFGKGPAMRGNVNKTQIELELRHDFLDEVISEKKPVIVNKGTKMICSGLDKIIMKLNLEVFIILPIINYDQIIGIMILEPKLSSSYFLKQKINFLTSFCSELASIIVSKKYEDKLNESDKMQMAQLFSSGMSHNFNNVLQAIMSQASLLKTYLSSIDPKLANIADQILKTSNNGAKIIKQLSSYSLPININYEVINIQSLLNDSQDYLRSLITNKNIFFNLLVNKNKNLFLKGDYYKIQNLIKNILLNSNESCKDNEKDYFIKITSKLVYLSSNELSYENVPGEYVKIIIEDNGEGMDEVTAKRCFEPFFTTKNTDKISGLGLQGSGLGLSEAYAIALEHKGFISVQSIKNVGSVFNIFLPIYKKNSNN